MINRSGQTIVEMMLILPVFLGIVFTIMEIGYVSFHVILLNHATYEVARIAGMTSASSIAGHPPNVDANHLGNVMFHILGNPTASVDCVPEGTLPDPQAQQQNYDLICSGRETIKLVFPISSLILSSPGGSGLRPLKAVVRMPVEQPLRR